MKTMNYDGKRWYVLGTFLSRSDANERKNEINEQMLSGKIKPKAKFEIIEEGLHKKSQSGMRMEKWFLLARSKE